MAGSNGRKSRKDFLFVQSHGRFYYPYGVDLDLPDLVQRDVIPGIVQSA